MNKNLNVLIGCVGFAACIFGSVHIHTMTKEIRKDHKKAKAHKLTENISYTIEPDITYKK